MLEFDRINGSTSALGRIESIGDCTCFLLGEVTATKILKKFLKRQVRSSLYEKNVFTGRDETRRDETRRDETRRDETRRDETRRGKSR